MTKLILDILLSIGSIATFLSVVWAIFVYIRFEERRNFSRVRDVLSSLRESISQLDGLMSEPEFALLGYCISKRIMELKPDDWTLPEFTEFLEDEKNHNQIAQAIHVGRIDCDFVERTEEVVSQIRKSPAYLKEKLPLLSSALESILFYVIKPGETVLSPRVFGKTFCNPEMLKKSLHEELEQHEYQQHYATEIALFAASIPKSLMNGDRFGQKNFDLSERITNTVINTFNRLSDAQLRKASSFQISNYEKTKKINNKHAIEDAKEILQLFKEFFTDKEWDSIIECKGQIVQLMES